MDRKSFDGGIEIAALPTEARNDKILDSRFHGNDKKRTGMTPVKQGFTGQAENGGRK